MGKVFIFDFCPAQPSLVQSDGEEVVLGWLMVVVGGGCMKVLIFSSFSTTVTICAPSKYDGVRGDPLVCGCGVCTQGQSDSNGRIFFFRHFSDVAESSRVDRMSYSFLFCRWLLAPCFQLQGFPCMYKVSQEVVGPLSSRRRSVTQGCQVSIK